MSGIVEQIERAMAKIFELAGNSEIYVCGHSAGGHLAAMMLYVNFKEKYKVSSKNLTGIIPVSGVFDLRPLLKTDINDNLKMDLNEASNLSPMLKEVCFVGQELRTKIKILLTYGENDSKAFKDQSNAYSEVLKN